MGRVQVPVPARPSVARATFDSAILQAAVAERDAGGRDDGDVTGANVSIPTFQKLMWPTLGALKAMGRSATVQEIYEKVVQIEGFTEEQQNVLHGRTGLIEDRLAWARSYLRAVGAVENSSRGVWSLTDTGRSLTPDDMEGIPAQVAAAARPRPRRRSRSARSIDADAEHDWQTELLELILSAPPDAFERLCRRLLREAGFISVTVTGGPGDEGIDGIGVYRLALVSFPVFFQAKRYRGSVRAGAVRDFRGAMTGRGDKGLLITTGSFTAEAKHEATRDGAPPIDLIDGDRLCELLKDYSLGVTTTTRIVEEITVRTEFFLEI
jgi:restriction system protein